jgi:hypothetical protein
LGLWSPDDETAQKLRGRVTLGAASTHRRHHEEWWRA